MRFKVMTMKILSAPLTSRTRNQQNSESGKLHAFTRCSFTGVQTFSSHPIRCTNTRFVWVHKDFPLSHIHEWIVVVAVLNFQTSVDSLKVNCWLGQRTIHKRIFYLLKIYKATLIRKYDFFFHIKYLLLKRFSELFKYPFPFFL